MNKVLTEQFLDCKVELSEYSVNNTQKWFSERSVYAPLQSIA